MKVELFCRRALWAWLLVLSWVLAVPVYAGVVDAPADQLQVSLITYGPGATYWERFGHDAIELRDPASDEAISFNYGEFDFNEQGFLWHFIRGHMRYLMDAVPSAEDQGYYRKTGRLILRQTLRLTPTQAARLRRFLLWNLQPQQQRYPYDYYRSNCATKVRDALNFALDDALALSLPRLEGFATYRQESDRLMAAQPWLMLAIDLGLSSYADHPLKGWDSAFLPATLSRELDQQRLLDHQAGRAYPLVSSRQLLAPNGLTPPPAQPPGLFWPLLGSGLALALGVLFGTRYWPPLALALGSLYLLWASLVGLLLLFLWLGTDHRAAWANANLWLFNPLALAWLAPLWRRLRGKPPGRIARLLRRWQGLALCPALGAHLLPGVVQQNQPWIGFALPVWLALWACCDGLILPRRQELTP